MGRIKSLMVKRAAKQLLSSQQLTFTNMFNDNKRVLARNMPSKPIRNKIAGYIARLVRMKGETVEREARIAARTAAALAAQKARAEEFQHNN